MDHFAEQYMLPHRLAQTLVRWFEDAQLFDTVPGTTFAERWSQPRRLRQEFDGLWKQRSRRAATPQEQHEALQARRERQITRAFKQAYAQGSGVEGTMSQRVRSCDVRYARALGLANTRLQHGATASAMNLIRLANWLDETPRAKTRYGAFERLHRRGASA